MSSGKGIPAMPFIISTSANEEEPETRKLIRSHVMRGKKWKWSRPGKGRKPKASEDSTGWNEATTCVPIQSSMAYQSIIPSKVGTDLSFTQFADTMEPCMFDGVRRLNSIAKEILFPLQSSVVFHKHDRAWFNPLLSDAAYLNAIVFASQAFSSLFVFGCHPSDAGQGAALHLTKTLRLLRERLAIGNNEALTSDATLWVVITLAYHAHTTGDHDSARYHMEGLRRIIDLRGGLITFSHENKILIESLRCDLGIAIQSGSRTVFFSDDICLDLSIPYPDLLLPIMKGKGSATDIEKDIGLFSGDISVDLSQAWKVTKQFCTLMNLAVATTRRISKGTLLETMAAVMYRLLHMTFSSNSANEMLRLGLLAFCSHVFLQWRDLKLPYVYFPALYKSTLLAIESSQALLTKPLLWILMMGSISVFSGLDDQWIVSSLRAHLMSGGAGSWGEMRDILKSFLWIDCLHDKPGKFIFDSVHQ